MYSLFAFIGIVSGVAALYASLYASKVKYNKGAIILVIYATALGCICGAWLTDNVAHFIAGEPFGFGGISANGGIIGALVTCYFSCVIIFGDKNSARFFINEVIPTVTLIHAFGRIGCYFGGCCYGVPSRFGIGVTYPEGSRAANDYGFGTKLVPTQFIESAYLFALTAVFVLFVKKNRLAVYLYAYGIYRFIAEFWRGDNRGSILPFISPSQFTAILFVVFATVLLIVRKIKGDQGIIVPQYLPNAVKDKRRKRRGETDE